MLSLDALALGLYAVNGTSKAMMYHMSGTTAVFLGMFTALGGGLIRDMLGAAQTQCADGIPPSSIRNTEKRCCWR